MNDTEAGASMAGELLSEIFASAAIEPDIHYQPAGISHLLQRLVALRRDARIIPTVYRDETYFVRSNGPLHSVGFIELAKNCTVGGRIGIGCPRSIKHRHIGTREF
jgi:hypothetical protein